MAASPAHFCWHREGRRHDRWWPTCEPGQGPVGGIAKRWQGGLLLQQPAVGGHVVRLPLRLPLRHPPAAQEAHGHGSAKAAALGGDPKAMGQRSPAPSAQHASAPCRSPPAPAAPHPGQKVTWPLPFTGHSSWGPSHPCHRSPSSGFISQTNSSGGTCGRSGSQALQAAGWAHARSRTAHSSTQQRTGRDRARSVLNVGVTLLALRPHLIARWQAAPLVAPVALSPRLFNGSPLRCCCCCRRSAAAGLALCRWRFLLRWAAPLALAARPLILFTVRLLCTVRLVHWLRGTGGPAGAAARAPQAGAALGELGRGGGLVLGEVIVAAAAAGPHPRDLHVRRRRRQRAQRAQHKRQLRAGRPGGREAGACIRVSGGRQVRQRWRQRRAAAPSCCCGGCGGSGGAGASPQ